MAYKRRVRTQEEVDKLRDNYTNAPPNEFKPLSQKEKHFLYQAVYNCQEWWRAFEIAYPAPDGREYSKEYCSSKAERIKKRPHVQRRLREMEEEMQKQLEEKGLWTREESVKYLRDLLEHNLDEQKRIDETYNRQIDLLLIKVEQAETPHEKEKLMNQVIDIRKKLREKLAEIPTEQLLEQVKQMTQSENE